MATLNPYINFKGNTEEAFNFYKSVFGGEFQEFVHFRDIPNGPPLPESVLDKIMHISLPIGKGNRLQATDMVEGVGHPMVEGNNFSLELECESKEEADKYYHALVAGGTPDPMMPIGDTFWGAYFGMLTDKFGIRWMINYNYPEK